MEKPSAEKNIWSLSKECREATKDHAEAEAEAEADVTPDLQSPTGSHSAKVEPWMLAVKINTLVNALWSSDQNAVRVEILTWELLIHSVVLRARKLLLDAEIETRELNPEEDIPPNLGEETLLNLVKLAKSLPELAWRK